MLMTGWIVCMVSDCYWKWQGILRLMLSMAEKESSGPYYNTTVVN